MKQRNKSTRVLTILSVILLLAVLAISAVTTWRATSMFLDGDASSELILSKQLWSEGVLISPNWDYSTEVRVIVTQNLLEAPLFGILSDWHQIRFVASMLWQVFLVLCWGFLARQLECNIRRFCVGGVMLLLPFSVAYGRLVLYCIFYCPIIGFCFLMTGVFLWCVKRCQSGTKRQLIIASVVMFISAAFAGLHGVRYMMNITAPLCLSVVLLLLLRAAERKQNLTEFTRGNGKSYLPVILLAVGSMIGCVIYSTVLMTTYHCDHEYVSRALANITVSDAWDMVLAWIRDFGYNKGVSLFSREGIAGVLGAVCAVGTLIAGFSWLRDREASWGKRFAAAMFLMSLGVVAIYMALVAGEADYENYDRYFLLAATFAVPMLMAPAAEKNNECPAVVTPRSFLSVCCVLAMLFSGANTLTYFNTLGGNIYMTYEGITYKDQLTVWKLQGVKDFLLQEGYDTGLALGSSGYWYSPVITELTNGAVRLGYINNDGIIRMNDRNFLTDPEQLTEGKFFLIIENDKESGRFYNNGWSEGGTVVYQDSYFTVVDYADPVAKFGSLCVPRS